MKGGTTEVRFEDQFETCQVSNPSVKRRNRWIPEIKNTKRRLSSNRVFQDKKYHSGMEF